MASASQHAAQASPARHVARTGGVALGIDIGGSGVKGAPVDLQNGTLTAERFRLDTPQPAKPRAVAQVVGEVVRHFDWSGPIGITFPGVISRGTVRTAANMDPAWIGMSAAEAFGPATGASGVPFVINDADAAGLAEITHGAALGQNGVALMLTFGTGIGSALFVDGRLVPNTELGHLQMRGKDAELRASARVRDEKNLGWAKWAKRVQEYLEMVDALFSPDLVVIGGGVSKHGDKFIPLLRTRAHIVAAQMANDAGIIGAALAAAGAVPGPPSEAAEQRAKAAVSTVPHKAPAKKTVSATPRKAPAKTTASATAKKTPAKKTASAAAKKTQAKKTASAEPRNTQTRRASASATGRTTRAAKK